MKKIGIGVIGCGSIANSYHMPALARNSEVRFVQSCDLIVDRAKEAAEKYHFEKWTLDYRDLLHDPNIDAVFILTRGDSHAEIAINCAEAGKHIFMQKPFSYNLEDAAGIIKTVQRKGIKFTPSFMHRYFDACREAKKILADGKLGSIEQIRVRNNTKNNPQVISEYGGCIMDVGQHGIDLIRYLTGMEIKKVFAQYPKSGHLDIPEGDLNGNELYANLFYYLDKSCTALHEISWSHISMINRFEVVVYCTKGCLYLYAPNQESDLVIGYNADGDVMKKVKWEKIDIEKSFYGEMLHRNFISDLINGAHTSNDEYDGAAPMLVIDAARRSFVSGSMEAVSQYNNEKGAFI